MAQKQVYDILGERFILIFMTTDQSAEKPKERVSPILVMLMSHSGSSFERSNISFKENEPDGIDPKPNGFYHCIQKKELYDFRQIERRLNCTIQNTSMCKSLVLFCVSSKSGMDDKFLLLFLSNSRNCLISQENSLIICPVISLCNTTDLSCAYNLCFWYD